MSTFSDLFSTAKRSIFGVDIPPAAQGQPLAVKSKNIDKNEPVKKEVPLFRDQTIVYPDGLDLGWNKSGIATTETGPSMKIVAFQYQRGSQKLDKNLGSRQFTILLPLPGNMQQSYSGIWQQFDGGLIGSVSQDLAGGADTQSTTALAGQVITNSIKNQIEDAAKNNPKLKALYDAATDQTTKNLISAAQGVSINPRQEIAFGGMQLRKHSFAFNLTPRNQNENVACRNIINLLRKGMHSTYQAGKVALEYPMEFIIEFKQSNGDDVAGIPSIPDCYLTNFSVNFNPGSQIAKLHVDGMPIAYQIQMQFSESVMLSREDLDILGV